MNSEPIITLAAPFLSSTTREEEPNQLPTVASTTPHAVDRLNTAAPIVEPAHDDRPAIADLVPAPATPLPVIGPSAAEEVVAPERIVHVRIGAIEIHGTAATPAAQTAMLPQSTPPPTPRDSDFDRYAGLRSYLAWQV